MDQVDALTAAFDKAAANLRSPSLRVGQFAIYKKPDCLVVYVNNGTHGRPSLGRVKDGKFILGNRCTEGQEAAFIEAANDPKEAAIKYGRLTGACAICGRHLENKESIERGIGPICAERFGW
jgi:hypothetical protein